MKTKPGNTPSNRAQDEKPDDREIQHLGDVMIGNPYSNSAICLSRYSAAVPFRGRRVLAT
jgi:hypothetical protein